MLIIPALCVLVCGLLSLTQALDNGLALTPPMGWLSWLRFGCTVDCYAKPMECISENLIKRTADLMVSEGYLAAGYQYITIDDCWLEKARDAEGRLVADRKRFPNGMKALSDYVHSKGLQFGMYEDYGNNTCAGYPGIQGHELYDADTLASWGTDYLKLDGCDADVRGMGVVNAKFRWFRMGEQPSIINEGQIPFQPYKNFVFVSLPVARVPVSLSDYSATLAGIGPNGPRQFLNGFGMVKQSQRIKTTTPGYPAFGRLLNATGRPIVYGCSWPMFQEVNGIHSNYSAVAENCNIWRNWVDIRNSWSSVLGVMKWIGDHQDRLAPFAGPGHWNDPDMLVVGNSGLTVDQAQVQMAVWAILAAPLMISVDLAEIQPEFKQILLNRDVISVNQDQLGKQGLRVWKSGRISWRPNQEIWHRQLSDGAHALAFVNRHNHSVTVTYTHHEMKLPQLEYDIQDLFISGNGIEQTLKPNKSLTLRINPTGVKFYKFTLKNC